VLQSAREALAAGRATDLHRHLHSLAGSAGMMGAEPLRQRAQQMEHHALEGRAAEVERELPQLAALMARFLEESAAW
jgi:HPt (histidine-containing phosphotransfer) domain-containing protein